MQSPGRRLRAPSTAVLESGRCRDTAPANRAGRASQPESAEITELGLSLPQVDGYRGPDLTTDSELENECALGLHSERLSFLPLFSLGFCGLLPHALM